MKCPWRDDLWAENKSALSQQRDEGLGAGKGDGERSNGSELVYYKLLVLTAGI